MAGVLEDLDPEQAAAAMAATGPVCIIAGAGTGKTRTVTHRLAYAIETHVVRPSSALAVTHSRKAAAELRERLGGLGVRGVDALTFHAAALRVVSRYWDRTGRREPAPSVLSESDSWRLWRDALRKVSSADPDNAAVRDLSEEVDWARARRVASSDYPKAAAAANRNPGLDFATIVAGWNAYNGSKKSQGGIDFADLLEIATDLIDNDESVSQAVRARWSYVTVDEYQDVDPAQQRLLEAIGGDHDDLCVVGDPRQAIYSWKGAEPAYLSGFIHRFPSARVFDLTHNYRSSPEIVAWANRLARGPAAKLLVTDRPSGSTPTITRTEDEAREAAWVAEVARRAVARGVPSSEIAVLYRFNAAQARFEAALARAGVATLVAEDSPFFERDEIRGVLVPFGRAARAQPGTPGLELLRSFLARVGFDRDRPPEGFGAARARWESHQALLELVETDPQMAGANATELLAQVNTLAVTTSGPRSTGVTLATLHRAKGLEWDVVFLVGLNDGTIPSSFAETAEELAEEERLLHVGVSRARRELYLTWPGKNARGWENRPSPYLEQLPSPAPKRERSAGRGGKAGHARVGGSPSSSAICVHCAGPLKGISARRLGVCPSCVTRAPGQLGQRARAVAEVIQQAAHASGQSDEHLVSASGLARLLEQRPSSVEDVEATPGVRLQGRWAKAVADALSD